MLWCLSLLVQAWVCLCQFMLGKEKGYKCEYGRTEENAILMQSFSESDFFWTLAITFKMYFYNSFFGFSNETVSLWNYSVTAISTYTYQI